MALEDYKVDMMRCEKDSICKFVPLMLFKTKEFSEICPSIMRYNFHTYSVSGRLFAALGFLRGRHSYSDSLLDMIYNCQLCGACDVACKAVRDLEPLEAILEWRVRCVEDGQILPQFMPLMDGLRKEDNMMQGLKADRGKWAKGLGVKDLARKSANVCFHAGCRYSFDEELWPTLQGAVKLLQKAGVDFGIFGNEEACCGGRAYEMGYQGELTKYMEHNIEAWSKAGVKEVVTPCADCYAAFKAWYSRFGNRVEVFHITEYLDKLIKEGKLSLTTEVPLVVTYHDPCHLGRLSERYLYSSPGKPYIVEEKKVRGQICCVYDPPKPWRRGLKGVYEPPRDVLRSIPGLRLNEMERIKSWALCCGAGGGVIDSNPDFAHWTANKRVEEAKSTGAEAMVTSCPWCKRNFRDALKESGEKLEIYDVVDLVLQAV